jgi:negative regulator of sigma E activity
MDYGYQLRRLDQHFPELPTDIAERIGRALAAESAHRSDARPRGSGRRIAVPPQRSSAGQSLASYVPRQRTAGDRV